MTWPKGGLVAMQIPIQIWENRVPKTSDLGLSKDDGRRDYVQPRPQLLGSYA